MPRGSKRKYTEKQKRQAEHIEDSYEDRGFSENRAEGIAWATVNSIYGGGMKGGSATKRNPSRKRGSDNVKNRSGR